MGLIPIGLGTGGLPFSEVGFFYIQENINFRAMILNKDGVVSGGAYNDVMGNFVKGSYTGSGNGIQISAVESCKMTVFKLAGGPDDQAEQVAQVVASPGQIVYTGSVTGLNLYLVEAEEV